MLKKITILLIPILVLLASCASTENLPLVEKVEGDYVYIVDYKKINAIENAATRSKSNINIEWVNIPTKKITRKEYEELMKTLEIK